MTSNIGARQLKDFGQGVGFATQTRLEHADDHAKGVIQNALKKTFSPEFLNRIDDVLVFNSLEKKDMLQIIQIVVTSLLKRIDQMGFELILNDDAVDFLADKGFDPQFGARPLHRAVQKYLEDPLAEFILQENPPAGSKLKAIMNESKNGINIILATKVGTAKKS